MDTSTIFLLGAAATVIIIGIVSYFLSKGVKDAHASTPPDVTKQLFDLADKILIASLPGVAASATELDDEAVLTYFGIRGWKVTGSKETGYTAVKEAPDA